MAAIIKGLYALTPEMRDTAALLDKVRRCLRGGAAMVQYRSKSEDVALRHEQATELLSLCREFHMPLIINDDLRLATLIGADGVHLGEHDASLQDALINLGRDKIIGVSCYQDLALAKKLAAQGASYVAFGSFYPSTTKPEARPCPIETLVQAKATLPVPIVAIGGITPDNAGALVKAGADSLAVITSLFDAPDIEYAAHVFSSFFATKH